MNSSGISSSTSSDLSLHLKYPFFHLKFSCDGVPLEKKKKPKPVKPVEIQEDVQSIASQDIPWLSNNKHFCKIAFDEKLIVCKTLDKYVGEANINVYLTREYDLLVHNSWKLFDTECFDNSADMFDNISFTSLVRRTLVTLEEKYCEVDVKHERENHLYVCEKLDSYHVIYTKVKHTQPLSTQTHEYCLDNFKDILTQGSLLLLLRQMTLLNIQQIDPLHLLMSDGKLFDITFELQDFQCVLFDDRYEIVVKKITAYVTDPETNQLYECITTFLSENGRIVYQEWSRKQVVLRFDPRKDITSDYCTRHPVAKPTTRIPLETIWRQDMQLNSMYIQQSKAYRRDYETFYELHPELRSILRDYMKDLLLFKPDHPTSYTIHYFNELLF
ncbi:ciliogenesis-associated TTC17-interacting protein-like isoform X2 [Diaphorina citri]|uniref:Ciliogenesis-associated TTC17-interacting protein-like isoform X2 n=1 Tax=Diaphorina citri TaxID=121845 RepID=A0A1S3DNZ7_DIACI|nr:ciliogenesis-associated TTC17-interacting protein-like isoform X2 [Diaphorina citri]